MITHQDAVNGDDDDGGEFSQPRLAMTTGAVGHFALADAAQMWTDHTVGAAEIVQMRDNWKRWVRDYGRKCLPDWSICHLHPEDCHLR